MSRPHFKIRVYETRGPHVRCVVYAGEDAEHLANCGQLMMRLEEFEAFKLLLETGHDVLVGDLGQAETLKFDLPEDRRARHGHEDVGSGSGEEDVQ